MEMETTRLLKTDVDYIVRRLPKEVKKLLVNNAGRVFLAGGFVRSVIAHEEPSDIDLFGGTPEELKTLAQELTDTMEGATRLHETANAYTVVNNRIPVQFIHRWTYGPGEQEKLLAQFDFTVAKAVIWSDPGSGWRSQCDEYFYPDLASKRLRYTYPDRHEDVGGSLLRATKFLKRGYHISPEALSGVVARLIKGVRDDPESRLNMEDEQWLSQVVCGLLREVDPMNVDL